MKRLVVFMQKHFSLHLRFQTAIGALSFALEAQLHGQEVCSLHLCDYGYEQLRQGKVCAALQRIVQQHNPL